MIKFLKLTVLAIISIYLIALVYVYTFQASLTYFPATQDFEHCIGFENAQKITQDGTRMYYTPKLGSNTLVIYYHGNAGSACDRSFIADFIAKMGAASIVVEYDGYSNDSREPSEKAVFTDAENAAAFAKTLPYQHITVMSESIGSGPAIHHASVAPVSSLILISPFTTLPRVAAYHYSIFPEWLIALLAHDTYDNISHIQKYTGPLTIIHGTADTIIPLSFGKELFDAAPSTQKKFIPILGAGHNDMYKHNDVIKAMQEAL